MKSFLPPRLHQILIAIVKEFIASAEPIGSKAIVKKYDFSVSPATIRNEMAKLEELGFLFQPHTSSGRVPTDKAYRYYVNHILSQQMQPPVDVEAALKEYENLEFHFQKLIEYTVQLIADITHYTSLVLVPRFKRTLFRYIKITPIDGNRLLLIMMTNTGAILNKVIQVSRAISEEEQEKMTNILNERLSNKYFEDVYKELLEDTSEEMQEEIIQHIGLLTREALREQEDRLIYDGAKHLLEAPEFRDLDKLKTVFEALEDEKLVVEILKKTLENEGLQVIIGSENRAQEMKDCSIITATYGVRETPLGSIAVMGPTRMPYARIIPVINACAEIFSEKLEKFGE